MIDVAGLMAHLPGPDFPTGGILLGRDGIATAYATGRGRVWLRGRAHFESVPRGRQALVVTQLPYGVMKGGTGGFVAQVAELVRHSQISGIADLEDDSSPDKGMRVVITLTSDAEPTDLLHQLHARSPLQTSFLMKLVAVVDGAPRTLTLKDAIARWVEHRRAVLAGRAAAATAGPVDRVLEQELRAVAARFGDARRTEIRA